MWVSAERHRALETEVKQAAEKKRVEEAAAKKAAEAKAAAQRKKAEEKAAAKREAEEEAAAAQAAEEKAEHESAAKLTTPRGFVGGGGVVRAAVPPAVRTRTTQIAPPFVPQVRLQSAWANPDIAASWIETATVLPASSRGGRRRPPIGWGHGRDGRGMLPGACAAPAEWVALEGAPTPLFPRRGRRTDGKEAAGGPLRAMSRSLPDSMRPPSNLCSKDLLNLKPRVGAVSVSQFVSVVGDRDGDVDVAPCCIGVGANVVGGVRECDCALVIQIGNDNLETHSQFKATGVGGADTDCRTHAGAFDTHLLLASHHLEG